MAYYEPTLSLDADYYYKKSTQTVYVKSTMSTGLPAGKDCHFDTVNPDPIDPGNFIMKYNADNNGTIYQDHTYTDSQDIPVITNVEAQTEAEVVNIIQAVLAGLHKTCFTISCEVYKPDGQEGGATANNSGQEIKVVIIN